MKNFLLIFLLQGIITTFGQVHIIGYAPQFIAKRFSIWKEEDFISKKRQIVQDTVVNEKGIFKFKLPPGPIEKYYVGMDDIYGYFFVQDGATYKIEFISDNPQNLSYNLKEEIELNFYDLDSNDINYKILGFEAWLDYSLSELHFEENNEAQILRKISLVKLQIMKDAQKDSSAFFREYLRYSIGMNIDNMPYVGAPSPEDKFKFYFHDKPILYSNPYFFSYFESYYDQFISQLGTESANDYFKALVALDTKKQDIIIKSHPCTGDSALRSLIQLYILYQAMYSNFIPKSVIKANLKLQSENAVTSFHRQIAKNLIEKYTNLEIGDPFPFDQLNANPIENKFVYVHAYNPSNMQCIQELSALKKLKLTYGNKIEFLTLYVDKPVMNEAERKALDNITWKKIAIPGDDSIWNKLGITTFPYYLMLDKDMNLFISPALSPTPNGKYETIEKTFFDLTKP